MQAWVVGSGGGGDAEDALAACLADGVPLVIDADALQHLTGPLEVPAILTPHAGELARMLDVERSEVEARQLEHARIAAARFGATVVLKGRRSLVAAPDGRVRVTTTGVPWLATAGAGDVLAGVIGALLAAGLDPFDAASAGSWLHGAAATLASRGGPITATEVARAIPVAVRTLPSGHLRESGDMSHARAEIVVDLGAIRANVRLLRELAGPGTAMMTVVKADGYGHGILESARAARAGGAEWLGVATLDEALAVRDAGDTGRMLTWLAVPGEDYAAAIEHDIDLTAYTTTELDEIVAAAQSTDRVARVQLKVDTGLSRGGSTLDAWPDLVEAAHEAEAAGTITVSGIWSHFACSDQPDHPANDLQEDSFRAALERRRPGGLAA